MESGDQLAHSQLTRWYGLYVCCVLDGWNEAGGCDAERRHLHVNQFRAFVEPDHRAYEPRIPLRRLFMGWKALGHGGGVGEWGLHLDRFGSHMDGIRLTVHS